MNKNHESRFTPGDKVTLSLFETGAIPNCEVVSVKFTKSKVFYELYVPVSSDPKEYTRIPDVDSVYVAE
jgi:hypothetical protein